MKKQKFNLTQDQLKELVSNFNPENDTVLKRAIELGKTKHIPLDKAIEFAEQEFQNK